VLAPESIGNQFQAFEDRPKSFDAWDIDIYYDDKMWLAEPAASICLVENGPLRQVVEIKRRILSSTYTQRISLAHNSPRLDFDTTIQWNERFTLLKVAFPVDILSPQATYEIQWGSVQRPTHRNTSWDWGRFESCAHKWVDLSEGGYGVSLLNDCKYGHDIQANVMRITLLRSPSIPDPMADYGEHRFAYSLLPHGGGWEECTQAAAYALNDPIIAYSQITQAGKESAHIEKYGFLQEEAINTTSLFSVSAPNVIIETIKRAEDGEGIIIRLYESQRKRGPVTVQCAFPLKQAWETNLLEENQSTLSVDKCSLHLELKPFQIITLRLIK
jgi:alpha-mannosidase